MSSIPGVEAAGYTDFGAPLEGTGSLELIAGGSRTAPDRPVLTMFRPVSPGYFQAFGIPLLKGDRFTERHLIADSKDVIVNETFVKTHWPGENPIGKSVFTPGDKSNPVRIIGVVKDVKEVNRASLPRQEIYIPNPGSAMEALVGVRTSGDPMRLLDAILSSVKAVDPNIPMYHVRRLEQVVSADLAPQTFLAGFLALFAGIAACLAAIGIYGVVSYAAGRRTREIGIRIALGATRWSILRALGGRYLVMAAFGLAAGLAGSMLAAGMIRHFLYKVAPYDPGTLVGVAGFLIAVTGIAAWLPARRAALSDPQIALKHE